MHCPEYKAGESQTARIGFQQLTCDLQDWGGVGARVLLVYAPRQVSEIARYWESPTLTLLVAGAGNIELLIKNPTDHFLRRNTNIITAQSVPGHGQSSISRLMNVR